MLNINLDKISDLDFKTREAYKTLRTNVQFCGDDVKLISLTSSVPNEGKSMVAFNLADSMAEGGSKVLFIDARNYFTVVDRTLNEWSDWQLKNMNAIVWLYR